MSVVDQLRDRVIPDHAVEVVRRAADLAVAQTQAAASERTGATRQGITHTDPVVQGNIVSCTITSAEPSSRFQDEGTGIYGPRGERITPLRPGGVLAFDWPAAGGVVFARSVAGSPGKHFFTEPMPARWSSCVHESGGPP